MDGTSLHQIASISRQRKLDAFRCLENYLLKLFLLTQNLIYSNFSCG